MAKYDIEALHEYMLVILKNKKLSDADKVEMLIEVAENLKGNADN